MKRCSFRCLICYFDAYLVDAYPFTFVIAHFRHTPSIPLQGLVDKGDEAHISCACEQLHEKPTDQRPPLQVVLGSHL